MTKKQSDLKNEKVKKHPFLEEMYEDEYFPDNLVDKGKAILLELCFQIEESNPGNLEALYELTHAATDKFNDLQEEFYENDSELETAARECIAMDFEFIATAYGFENADVEELIATRDW
ncbi:MAG: hypothetical protein JST26_13350 [Bacteroidetes bacterium]|nr:hypothetical protein [Bacteroidota bacterium]